MINFNRIIKATYKQDLNGVIEPHASLIKINFKDVCNYRNLLWILVKRDFICFLI
jgi:hypothetical protein